MAAHAGMSVRTFTRRFKQETATTPGSWLNHQRIELARRLLESTQLPIDQVARCAGLGSAASLRKHLRAQVGVSPASYRSAFGHGPRIPNG